MCPKTEQSLQVGDKAPDFTMPATNVGEVRLTNLLGKPFVLYFYPKDDTPGCTTEACGFRDALPQFATLGLTVIGVSKDSLVSHERFQEKFGLNFPLAADESGEVCVRYGVWVEKNLYGKKSIGIERTTFLMDGTGTIRAIWRRVSVAGHVEQVRQAAASLQEVS